MDKVTRDEFWATLHKMGSQTQEVQTQKGASIQRDYLFTPTMEVVGMVKVDEADTRRNEYYLNRS